MASVTHKKNDAIPAWTQADMDKAAARYQAAFGEPLYPPGATINDIVLSDDWNDEHDVTIEWGDITGDINDQTDLIALVNSKAASPGGSTTQVQFNDSGVFGGDADFTWNKTTNVLDVNGSFALGVPTTNAIVLGDISGNARGSGSIDIQTERYAATSVASGVYAFLFGAANEASASPFYGSGAFGYLNTAGGYTMGAFNTVNAESIGFGYNLTVSSSTGGVGIGGGSMVSGTSFPISIGNGANAQKTQTVSIGNVLNNDALYSVNIGLQNDNRFGERIINIANQSVAFGNNDINLGTSLKNLYPDTIMIGNGVAGGRNAAPIVTQDQNTSLGGNDAPQVACHVIGDIIASGNNNPAAELITNGSFTGSATGWTLGTGWAYASNQVGKNANGTGTLSQAFSTTASRIYRVTFNITLITAIVSTGTFTVSIGGWTSKTIQVYSGQTKTVEMFVVGTASSAGIVFTPDNLSRFGIDNVSVREVTDGNIIAHGGYKVRASLNTTTAGNTTAGSATMVGGTVTVNTTAVTANSIIMLTGQNNSGTTGELRVNARVAGTSFTISSSNVSDTRLVGWIIYEPI